jgi:aminoglycoside phosphotransferase (APT) family kinase protein
VDREFRIMAALAHSAVPVPEMILYSDDRSIVGTPFYLMERVEGRVFSAADIAGVDAASRAAMYRSATEVLARLHTMDWARCGLADFGKPGNYFQRQINRWSRQWQSSKTKEIPEIDRLAAWLPNHIPTDERTAICHGDYRIGNLMFHVTEPRVVAVLDWELSTLGHPLADLGFFCIPFHTAPEEYGGIVGLDRAALGIPSEDEIVAHYSSVVGGNEILQPFHLAFALFRFAVIFAGIQARAAQGNAADPNADAVAHLSTAFAMRACDLVGI